MAKLTRIELVKIIREEKITHGSKKGLLKTSSSYEYASLQSVKAYDSLKSETSKKYEYNLKIDDKAFQGAIETLVNDGGYKALISTDDTVQYELYNFVTNMVLYIKRHRIAFANAPKQEVLEQDLCDVVSDSYTRIRCAFNEYANNDKTDINNELMKRFRRVTFRNKKDVLETMTDTERETLVHTIATQRINEFNLDTFSNVKYVCACLVGQLYDAYLMRIGRETPYATTDIILSENDGVELNTIGAIFAKRALQFARNVENDTDTINIINLNMQKVDVYFENNKNDFEKFNEIKAKALALFESQSDKTKVRLNKLVDDNEKRFLYRLRDRINLFYANIESSENDDTETLKANARRLTRREKYAMSQKALALKKARAFVELVNEYKGTLDIASRFDTVQYYGMTDLRKAQCERLEDLRNERESVYVQRNATYDI